MHAGQNRGLRVRLHAALTCVFALVLSLLNPERATADCASYCQGDYWACIESSDSSACGTQRAICVQDCISNGETGENFGAIAFSPSTEIYGYSRDYALQSDAESRALKECRAAGGSKDCEVVLWFRNTCGALASDGEGAYGAEWAETALQAQNRALAYCAEQTSRSCSVRFSLCTE